MQMAVVETATGNVSNIIEWELGADWACPVGCELIDATPTATIGGTWNGSQFIAPNNAPTRLTILMADGPATQVYDEATDAMVDRPAEDIAADKAELLGLLQAQLAASEDLTWEEMNKMLALERES